MIKKIIVSSMLTATLSFGFFGHHVEKIVCMCMDDVSCTSVIAKMKVAKKIITLNYKLMDKLMAIKMDAIRKEEEQIKSQQEGILKLTTQIRRIQEAIAFEDRKNKFLLNQLKQINTYKEIK